MTASSLPLHALSGVSRSTCLAVIFFLYTDALPPPPPPPPPSDNEAGDDDDGAAATAVEAVALHAAADMLCVDRLAALARRRVEAALTGDNAAAVLAAVEAWHVGGAMRDSVLR